MKSALTAIRRDQAGKAAIDVQRATFDAKSPARRGKEREAGSRVEVISGSLVFVEVIEGDAESDEFVQGAGGRRVEGFDGDVERFNELSLSLLEKRVYAFLVLHQRCEQLALRYVWQGVYQLYHSLSLDLLSLVPHPPSRFPWRVCVWCATCCER